MFKRLDRMGPWSEDFSKYIILNSQAHSTNRKQNCNIFVFSNHFSLLVVFKIKNPYLHVRSTGFDTPTPVQRAVIPRLLNGENLVMAASTGSGKTLAFTLPVIQTLISQEYQVAEQADTFD